MSKKIFASMLSVSVVVLLLCVLSISYVLYGYFGNIIENVLRTEEPYCLIPKQRLPIWKIMAEGKRY